MIRFAPLLLLPLLTACGGDDPRYLLPTGAGATTQAPARTALYVATLEVRDVSLPAYASDDLILREDASGALVPVDQAIWADTPPRAVTQLLADRLGATTTAQVAAEPWPLSDQAQAAVDVRVSELAARQDGNLHMRGQFAISSYDRIVRERIVPFAIAVSLSAETPAAIAAASGTAIDQLAAQITAQLSR